MPKYVVVRTEWPIEQLKLEAPNGFDPEFGIQDRAGDREGWTFERMGFDGIVVKDGGKTFVYTKLKTDPKSGTVHRFCLRLNNEGDKVKVTMDPPDKATISYSDRPEGT